MPKIKLLNQELNINSDYTIFTETLVIPSFDDVSLIIWFASYGTDSKKIFTVVKKTMLDYFAHNLNEKVADNFEEALKVVNKEIVILKDKIIIPEIDAVIAILDKNLLHLSQTGNSELYLAREGSLSTISYDLAPDKDAVDLFVNIASGALSSDDHIIFSTQRVLRYLSKNEFASALHTASIAKGIEDVVELVRIENPKNFYLSGFSYVTEIRNIVDTIEQKDNNQEHSDQKDTFATENINESFVSFILNKLKIFIAGQGRKTRSYQDKKRLTMIVVATVVVILLFILLVSNISANTAKKEEFIAKKAQISELISIAENKIIAKERDVARTKIREAQILFSQIENSGLFKDDVAKIKDTLKKENDLLDGIVRFDKPTLYAQVNAKNPRRLIFYDAFYVIDAGGIYGPFDKNAQNIIFKKLPDEAIIGADKFIDQGSIVLVTKSGKLVEYKRGAFSFPTSRDSGGFKKMTSVRTFGTNSNSVYGLDAKNDTIWKYPKTGSSYTFPRKYNTSGSVKDVISIAIDGAVYGLRQNGTVIKFYRGGERPFKLLSMPTLGLKNLKNARIFTTENHRNIYITDPQNHRILQLRKLSDGSGAMFMNQFVIPSELNIVDIFVRDNETTIYVLTDDQVYTLPI